jgi:hypothetical protein
VGFRLRAAEPAQDEYDSLSVYLGEFEGCPGRVAVAQPPRLSTAGTPEQIEATWCLFHSFLPVLSESFS